MLPRWVVQLDCNRDFDGAQVTRERQQRLSALGSAGKGIKINAGTGNNTITGSAQSDTITTSLGQRYHRG